MKAENLKARAKEDFDIDILLQEFSDANQYDFTAAREEVHRLKEKVNALGAVNFATGSLLALPRCSSSGTRGGQTWSWLATP